MRSVDDLIAEGVSGRRVLLRADLNVPLDKQHRRDHRRRPDPGQPAHPAGPAGRRRAGDRRRPPRPAQGRARPAVLPRAGGRAARRAARAPTCRSPPTSPATTRRPRPPPSATATSCCWRTSASRPPRRRRTTPSAASWPTGWPPSPTSTSTTRSAPCTASTPRCSTSPSGCRTAAGRLVARELEVLTRLTTDPDRPYVVVLGGSKVSDKLAVIEALLPKVDRLLVGGGMCFTFLAAQGHGVGSSLLEADQVDTCRRLLDEAGDRIVLPVDVVCADGVRADAETSVVAGRRDPGRPDGPRRRPAHRRGVRRRAGRRPHRLLERPDGRVRAGPLPGGHPRGGRGRRAPSTGCPSSAAGTPPPPSGSSASTRTPTATSAPAAARRWSTSRAGSCPGLAVLAD